jgi:hypothetical protein
MDEWRIVATLDRKDAGKMTFLMCVDCGWRVTAPSSIVGAEMQSHKEKSDGRCV